MFVCFGDAQEAPLSADDPNPSQPTIDPTAEGARARAENKPREACPYAPDTEERHEWLEGYDAISTEGAAHVPEAMLLCGNDPGARSTPPARHVGRCFAKLIRF